MYLRYAVVISAPGRTRTRAPGMTFRLGGDELFDHCQPPPFVPLSSSWQCQVASAFQQPLGDVQIDFMAAQRLAPCPAAHLAFGMHVRLRQRREPDTTVEYGIWFAERPACTSLVADLVHRTPNMACEREIIHEEPRCTISKQDSSLHATATPRRHSKAAGIPVNATTPLPAGTIAANVRIRNMAQASSAPAATARSQ